MRALYIDCFSGVAGDMLLAALIDAGANVDTLKSMLQTIGNAFWMGQCTIKDSIKHEWDIQVNSVVRSDGRIAAKHINVTSSFGHRPVPAPGTLSKDAGIIIVSGNSSQQHDHNHNHDHSHSDSAHYHGHDHSHGHSHISPSVEVVDHDCDHHHRGLSIIEKLITTSKLPEAVKQTAIAAFTELAHAEARVHSTTIDQVHFHEVGAVDSIVDTVGVIAALHILGIDQVYASALPMSTGTVWTAHGILPVPAPATLYLMRDMVLCSGPKSATGELCTPTGVSLIRVLCGVPSLASPTISASGSNSSNIGRQGVLPGPHFRLQAVGVGAGSKDFLKHPNILRVLIGETNTLMSLSVPAPLPPAQRIQPQPQESTRVATEHIAQSQVVITTPSEPPSLPSDVVVSSLLLIEANIDDATAESISYVQELLMEAGANDCWTEHIGMKKGRTSAVKLCALCKLEDKRRLVSVIFSESSTIGLRVLEVERLALTRSTIQLETKYGTVGAKVSFYAGRITTIKAEFEDCKQLVQSHAASTGMSLTLKEVMAEAQRCIQLYKETYC